MVSRISHFGTAAVSLTIAGLLAASPMAAQDVSYTSTTAVEFGSGGFLGGLLTRAAGAAGPITQTVHIKGAKMRTDSNNSSTIVDLDARSFVMLNHDAKTYSILTFEQMRALAEAAARAMREEVEAGDPADGDTDVDIEFDFSVERTGERQRFHGANAERFFMTIKAKATAHDEETDEEVSGTMVFLSDLWQSTDFAADRAKRRFQEAMGQETRDGAAGLADALQQAFAADPRMEAGLERAAREAEKLEGETVRSTVYLVTVPDGVEFDRAAVLQARDPEAQEEQPRRGGLRGLARAARRAAEQAEEDAEAEPRQMRLMSVTTEVTDVQTGNLPASLFEIPADYRQVQAEGLPN